MTAFGKIILLKKEKTKIQREIDKLKPQAIKELREMGYSYDNICILLGVGKITAIKIENKRLKNDRQT